MEPLICAMNMIRNIYCKHKAKVERGPWRTVDLSAT